ncbi:MAG: serine hydrolase [Victivallaceae bacterium]|nr:serine hydrolase [Victivallaceae bacterium]
MARLNRIILFAVPELVAIGVIVVLFFRQEPSVIMAANHMADRMNNEVKNFRGVSVNWKGRKIVERYGQGFGPDNLHSIASITKGLTSTACGFAIQEGLLHLNDRVIDFFPESQPEMISTALSELTVRDLLMMRSGYSLADEHTAELLEPRCIFAVAPSFLPGEHFVYGRVSCYLLSAIIAKVSGRSLEEFLRSRLFVPLGITEYQWAEDKAGISCGSGGLSLTLPGLAAVGEFYRQKGIWNNRRVLDAAWLDEATANQTPEPVSGSDNWNCGFGYLFWRNKFGGFRNDGSGGQLLVILPEQEVSIVLFSDSGDFDIPLAIIEQFENTIR